MTNDRVRSLTARAAIAIAVTAGIGSTASAQDKLWTVTAPPTSDLIPGFGWDLAGGGDVDGDGYPDVIVGEFNYEVYYYQTAGAAWIFSGKDGAEIYLVYPVNPLNYNTGFGTGVAILPDIDGDGHAEFAIGAPGDSTGANRGGAVYVYSGADASLKWSQFGASSEGIGEPCSVVDDYDLDGLRDVAVGVQPIGGAPSAVRILSSATGAEIRTIYSPSVARIKAIADGGDVNGDGVSDLIVGAPDDSTIAVVGGTAIVLSGADGSVIHQVFGTQLFESLGFAVAGLGDLNGDGSGHAEFCVGAPGHSVAGSSGNGMALVYSGVDAAVLYAFVGDAAVRNANLGSSMTSAGDLNGDGAPEFYLETDRRTTTLYSGRDGIQLYHLLTGLGYGGPCANVQDVDHDGVPDMVATMMGWYGFGGQGSVSAYSGDDWYLDASNRVPTAGQTVTLTMGQTDAGELAALFLVDTLGAPKGVPLFVGACDGTGRLSLSGTVPAGLAGTNIGLLSIGIGSSGKVVASSIERIYFL